MTVRQIGHHLRKKLQEREEGMEGVVDQRIGASRQILEYGVVMIPETDEQGLCKLILVAKMIEEPVSGDVGRLDYRLYAGGGETLTQNHCFRDRKDALTGLLALAEKLSRHEINNTMSAVSRTAFVKPASRSSHNIQQDTETFGFMRHRITAPLVFYPVGGRSDIQVTPRAADLVQMPTHPRIEPNPAPSRKELHMLADRYGNPVSTSSRTALEKYDEALQLIRLYWGDPIAALDAALDEDPDFTMAWAARADVLVQQCDKAYAEEIARSLRAGWASGGTAHERAHLAAAQDWADGRLDAGILRFARIAQEHPRDLLALQAAHVGCFFVGRASELRDWPLQAMRAFTRNDDGYHALLGMAAFGLEECGDYHRAEVLGREAVELDARDGWAVHAITHVHEMRGDTERGMSWLRDNSQALSPENGFSYHNWWHLALLHLDRNEHQAALNLYDSCIRPHPDAPVMLEWIDASALLWRLYLDGIDTGNRFPLLAACWERAIDDGIYAFNDLHALMAFIGAGRFAQAERTIAALRRAAASEGDNGYMARAVGLPLAEAFLAFANGHYTAAADAILAIRGIAQRFGGSHAQRDILSLTALHAAKRAGMAEVAGALAAERVAHKAVSPWARRLSREVAGPGMMEIAAAC
jgi:tetratricopeptide (TPR) repeat protein